MKSIPFCAIINLLDYDTSVSYTHLDVYKRQKYFYMKFEERDFFWN